MERSRTGLVADIGRQSVRFALSDGDRDVAPREVRSFLASEHSTFTAALMAYLDGVGLRNVALPSVLAVAGVARGDVINLTGSRWFISLSGVEAVLGTRPRALNECAASALALASLPTSAFTSLDRHPVRPVTAGGSYLIVNIGTGLGVAALVTGPDGRLVPVQSEGGHMIFAPGTPSEERFAARIKAGGRIASAESLLSAAGLVAAYAALAEGGKTVASPEEVTKMVRHDAVAAHVVQMFVGYLGAFVGDLVLAFGAWDGVYLGGAIPRALQVMLSEATFRQRLTAKSAFHRPLSEVPVAIVGRSDLVLLGAAAALSTG
ncbi:MAG: glucokinase [Sphingomonas sp.]|jgi:glucokinase|uniref:glucokinase n=1 Tax=Sphingomonas sp. TaxID=28214 RepID=UPI0035682B12